MTEAQDLASGKGANNENFPVAALVRKEFRAPITAFYNFVRIADDVADNETTPAEDKLKLLEDMRASLMGENQTNPQGVQLRAILLERGLTLTHAEEMLEAFRRDCTITRYQSWDDLIDYCRYSAMPVGRFMLDVHGESQALWPMSDALCAALQVINHLQDCAKDRKSLDRIYLPAELCEIHGVKFEMLDAPASPPALRGVLEEMAMMTAELLRTSAPFARGIKSAGLSFDVAVIQTLAEHLTKKLLKRDPLKDRVHHNKFETLGLCGVAFLRFSADRLRFKTSGQIS